MTGARATTRIEPERVETLVDDSSIPRRSGPPDVTVAVIVHRDPPLLDRCLTSLAAAGDVSIELLLLQNGPPRRTSIPRSVPGGIPCRIDQFAENVGFARGVVHAMGVARGRLVLLLNPDAQLHEGAVAHLVEALDAEPSCGAVSARIEFPDGRPQSCAYAFLSARKKLLQAMGLARWARRIAARPGGRRWLSLAPGRAARELRKNLEPASQPYEVDWATGACLLLRPEAVRAVGGVDPRFFVYFEDQDLCRRLHEGGWSVRVHPGARVVHEQGLFDDPSPQRLRLYLDAQREYVEKHFHGLERRVLLSLQRIEERRGRLLGLDVRPVPRRSPADATTG